MPASNANPGLIADVPGYDPSGHQANVAIQVTNVQTDVTTGVVYGELILVLGSSSAVIGHVVIDSGSVNISQFGGINTQMGDSSGSALLTHAPMFAPSLFDGGVNLYPERAFNGDGAFGSFLAGSGTWLFNGSSADRSRTPAIYNTATATASGDTALWTPGTGKKFRLMRWMIQVSANAAQAVAGTLDIVLRDATTGLAASLSVFVPSVAGTVFAQGASTGWVDWGNGQLSSTANNVLNINLSAALTAGKVRVIAIGTEE